MVYLYNVGCSFGTFWWLSWSPGVRMYLKNCYHFCFFNFSAFVWIAVSLLLCGYFGNTRLLSVTFLALGAGFGGGLGMAGHGINHIDIAPRWSLIKRGTERNGTEWKKLIKHGTELLSRHKARPRTHDPRSYTHANCLCTRARRKS